MISSAVSAPVSACSLTHGLVVVHGPPELQWYLMPPSLADINCTISLLGPTGASPTVDCYFFSQWFAWLPGVTVASGN